MRRLLRWLLLSMLMILVPPVAMLAVLSSESGTAWTLGQASELARTFGIGLEYGRIRGSLLRRLEIHGLVAVVGDSRFEAGRALLDWRPAALLGRRLHVRTLEIVDVRLVPPAPAETAPAPLEIPELRLPLLVRLDRLLVERLTVAQPEADLAVSRLALAARLDRQGLAVTELQLSADGAQLLGSFKLGADAPHLLEGDLSAQIDERLVGDDVGTVEANAVFTGTALSPVFDLTVSAPMQLHVRGVLELSEAVPGFDLSADWPGLSWPPQGEAIVDLRAGRLMLRGVPDDYRLELQTSVSGEGIPPAAIDLVASGGLGGMTLQPLRLDVLEGRLGANGGVRWDQGLSWELVLEADQINPGAYLADWPGQLGGRIEAAGSLGAEGEELKMQVLIDNLVGRLRGYPVSARGALDYRAGQLHARAFEFSSGPNRIAVDGYAGDRLDLGFDVKAPELASLYPRLFGAVQGEGRLKGTPQMPVVVAKLGGQAVGYGDLHVQDLRLDIDWRENGGKGLLLLSGVRAAEVQVARVTAGLDGSPQAHRLDLEGEAESGSIRLSAQGGLQQEVWTGELRELTVNESALGEWSLQSPTRLSLGADKLQGGRLCLAQAATSACAEGGWDRARGLDLAGKVVGYDLARLSAHLPGEAAIEGEIQAEFRVTGSPARPDVRFELVPGDGMIRVEETDEPIEISYRNARVSGRFENDRGSAEIGFQLGPNGRAQGQILLGPESGGQRSLGGKIDADFPDLALVSGFVPTLERVEGRLHLEAMLGGTLAAPTLSGALEIRDARARMAASGIELDDIELAITGAAEGPLDVRGRLSSGEGRLDIKGTADLAASDGPAIDLTVQGDRFRAVQLPEATVDVSPDLRLRGAGRYHLSGSLLIPKAAIELKEVPSGSVDVSGDEIIVGVDDTGERQQAAQNLTARVRIELGKSVTFKGFGLKTGLTGALDAAVDAGGTSLDGKIELRDAEYKAYGQDLTVERGRLLFAGPPGNPEINLRAVRVSNNGEVKAYLALTGPLSKPHPRIFSEPALSETEALAYLVTGRGLDQAGQGGGNIAGAAVALGLSTADPMIQRLTGGLGLDEITVDTGEEGLESSSVTLGKYLNPDLYVGYTQGLFNPEGAVLMRLRLREKLTIESRSGNEQAVDLIYRIEHD